MSLKPATSTPGLARKKGTFNTLELAAFLGVSRATVCRMNASGKLPRPIRFNRAVRWDCWTIEEWLAAGCPPRDKWEAMQQGR